MAGWLERALRISPGGSQTRSKAPGQVGPPLGADETFPLFASRGVGPFLYDAADREYLDFAGANAAIPLGYAHPDIAAAVSEAAMTGSLLSLPSTDEIEVSERFCRAVGFDMVRWVKTGSEAVAAAVRLARVHTGTSAVFVATHAYHGWHDWTQARPPFGRDDDWAPSEHDVLPNGVPAQLVNQLGLFDYEQAAAQRRAGDAVRQFMRQGGRVAAILVEPHRFMPQERQRESLQALRTLADESGAVLIFDEMVFGFRWAVGGASEWCGVRPDLACYGKALGNGTPIACVTGTRAIMGCADRAGISGTYGGDRLGLAAAGAVLQVYAQDDIIARLWANGRAFVTATEGGAHLLSCIGEPVHVRLVHAAGPAALYRTLAIAASRGVLCHRAANNASAAMTVDHAQHGGEVLRQAAEEAVLTEPATGRMIADVSTT